MKKTVLVFGSISGAVSVLLMFGSMLFVEKLSPEKGAAVGYAGMVLSFLLVFFGIRSFRDNAGAGSISFGRALAVGVLITLISSACYVAAWEIIYFKINPAVMEQYFTRMVEQVKSSGAGADVIQAKLQEMQRFHDLYQNPFFNALITFTEPLPLGLLITLISALILRKKPALPPIAVAAQA